MALNLFNILRIENLILTRVWDDYKSKYRLEFSGNEELVRLEIFLQNYKFVVDTNAKDLKFTLGMNQFGHLKKHELSRHLMHKKAPETYQDQSLKIVKGRIPIKFDWREKGVVSYVKNQFECGCGYAFSATGAMESAFAIETGKLPNLSEQEIVSCTTELGNLGCEGGLPENGFLYSMAKGISTSTDYPYTGDESLCFRNISNRVYKLKGYQIVNRGQEIDSVEALYNTEPISINLDSNHKEFLFYQSGVPDIPSCSSDNLNHAALAVGYNLEDENKCHLIVKNSFGPDWGEDGYFTIMLFKANMCGIATRATYPFPLT
ncbi:hypothetical protein MXB_4505 [Myxobolus squamalis]|nr:hypothetical protein MXB_4505 [Myxobolus squamalis]